MRKFFMLMDQAGDAGAGGAGAGGDKGAAPDLAKEVAELKAKLAVFETEKAKGDESLSDKVKAAQTKELETKGLESALKFTLSSNDFLKTNESLLPKEIGEIFQAADKEKYDSAIQKARAIKSSVIQEFFKLQANADLLTPAHKLALEQYEKLTKNGKEEKADFVFENIFEPALAMLKQVKKAEEVNRDKGGLGNPSDSEKQYVNRMVDLSKKHYLGEKSNA